MTIFTILLIGTVAVWLIMTSGIKQPRTPYISNAKSDEYIRSLTADERLAAWSSAYYGGGHHNNPPDLDQGITEANLMGELDIRAMLAGYTEE